MQYRRSPFREKQNAQERTISPRKTLARNQEVSFNEKQNTFQDQSYMQKSIQSTRRNPQFGGNTKHIQSEMVTEFQIDLNDKYEKGYKMNQKQDGLQSCHSKFEDNKKFNAKHLEIESKLNKIQSYHHKIQTLLEMVNRRPITPSKTVETTLPFTPSRSNNQQRSVLASRSTSKITPLDSKSKHSYENFAEGHDIEPWRPKVFQNHQNGFIIKNHQKLEIYQRDHRVYDRSQQRGSVNLNQQPFTHNQNKINSENRGYGKVTTRQATDYQDPIKQHIRRKSRQYMQSIQGQVKDIQNTIQILNQKIKQVDHISFRKQVVFDNLSTSNPESASDCLQKNSLQLQNVHLIKTPTQVRRQTRLEKEYQQNNWLRSRGQNAAKHSVQNDFQEKKTRQELTPSKYSIHLRNNNQGLINDSVKTGSSYDGDVEQSEDRNKYARRLDALRKKI